MLKLNSELLPMPQNQSVAIHQPCIQWAGKLTKGVLGLVASGVIGATSVGLQYVMGEKGDRGFGVTLLAGCIVGVFGRVASLSFQAMNPHLAEGEKATMRQQVQRVASRALDTFAKLSFIAVLPLSSTTMICASIAWAAFSECSFGQRVMTATQQVVTSGCRSLADLTVTALKNGAVGALWGIAALAFSVPVRCTVDAALNGARAMNLIGPYVAPNDVYGFSAPGVDLAQLGFSMVVVGPILEELVFRGAVQTGIQLTQWAITKVTPERFQNNRAFALLTSKTTRVFITSLAFTYIHLGNDFGSIDSSLPQILNCFAGSFLFQGRLRETTGGLVGPIATHMTNNGILFALLSAPSIAKKLAVA